MTSIRHDLTKFRSAKRPGQPRQIIGLLKSVGVPTRMLYVRRVRQHGSFWLRRINHLQVLESARQIYRRQIIQAHPDKPGGCLERTIQLNQAWSSIQRRFKRHGHELN